MKKQFFLFFIFLFVDEQIYARRPSPNGEPLVMYADEFYQAVKAPLIALFEKNCKAESNAQSVEPTNAHWTSEGCTELLDFISNVEHQAMLEKEAHKTECEKIQKEHDAIHSRR